MEVFEMKKMHVYDVYLDDGEHAIKVTIPASSKKEAIIQKPPVSQQTARRCTQRQAVGHTSVKEVRPCVLH
jgi:hypothetical protein